MKIVTLILVCLSMQFTALAQEAELGIKIEQEPTEWAHFLKKKKNHQVKKQVFLFSTLSSGYKPDTINIEYYDPQGGLSRVIRFSDQKRTSISVYETSKDRKITKWHTTNLKDKTASVSTHAFHASGKPAWSKSAEINAKGDTTSRSSVAFKYNSKQQLVERAEQIRGINTTKKTYIYNGNQVVKLVIRPEGTIWYEYVYNADQLPIKKEQHQSGSWGTAITKMFNYTYLNGLMATERYTDANGDQKDTEVSYTYDAEGRTKSFRAVRDTLFREVSFEFSGPLLKQINVKGNTTRGFTREYAINIGAPYTEKNEPFVYRQDFDYDDKGNLIRSAQFLDGIKYLQMDYQLEY
ncbi:hypothetical protein HDC92_003772 [Pedobacter sp. AK017]|uniref:hypothetical protein n=1 Tax=Pedobacter sp. AK017 TaxID=2723073 RepID=UPI001620DF71|nr:hypothetical protein [Pedobacter sp. AK017]MBB5440074.1 hypothetical protein [Pedobacter sp. AK017]